MGRRARDARRAGRAGDRAGAHRADRGRGAAQPRAGAGARRPRVGMVRAGGGTGRRRRGDRLGVRGPEPRLAYALRRRGQHADRRLPLRARSRDADVDDGGDGARRAGGRAVPQRGVAAGARGRRHAGARQDRHADGRAPGGRDRSSRSTAWRRPELLRYAASLEQASEHPMAAAVVRAAQAKGLRLGRTYGFKATPGAGRVGRGADAGTSPSAMRA